MTFAATSIRKKNVHSFTHYLLGTSKYWICFSSKPPAFSYQIIFIIIKNYLIINELYISITYILYILDLSSVRVLILHIFSPKSVRPYKPCRLSPSPILTEMENYEYHETVLHCVFIRDLFRHIYNVPHS